MLQYQQRNLGGVWGSVLVNSKIDRFYYVYNKFSRCNIGWDIKIVKQNSMLEIRLFMFFEIFNHF